MAKKRAQIPLKEQLPTITVEELFKPLADGKRTVIHLAACSKSLFCLIPETILKQIPINEQGWLMTDAWGSTLIHAAARENLWDVIPEDVLKAVPMDERGWLRTNFENKTPFLEALAEGCFDKIPTFILEQMPIQECLMNDRSGQIFLSDVISRRVLGSIPPKLIRAIPLGEQGWTKQAVYREPIFQLITYGGLDILLTSKYFPSSDPKTINDLDQFWQLCKSHMRYAQREAMEIDHYQAQVDRLKTQALIVQSRQGKKKFDLNS
jgi:hypothetical protein